MNKSSSKRQNKWCKRRVFYLTNVLSICTALNILVLLNVEERDEELLEGE